MAGGSIWHGHAIWGKPGNASGLSISSLIRKRCPEPREGVLARPIKAHRHVALGLFRPFLAFLGQAKKSESRDLDSYGLRCVPRAAFINGWSSACSGLF